MKRKENKMDKPKEITIIFDGVKCLNCKNLIPAAYDPEKKTINVDLCPICVGHLAQQMQQDIIL